MLPSDSYQQKYLVMLSCEGYALSYTQYFRENHNDGFRYLYLKLLFTFQPNLPMSSLFPVFFFFFLPNVKVKT